MIDYRVMLEMIRKEKQMLQAQITELEKREFIVQSWLTDDSSVAKTGRSSDGYQTKA